MDERIISLVFGPLMGFVLLWASRSKTVISKTRSVVSLILPLATRYGVLSKVFSRGDLDLITRTTYQVFGVVFILAGIVIGLS